MSILLDNIYPQTAAPANIEEHMFYSKENKYI